MWDEVQIIFTYTHSQQQSLNNLRPPPSPFVFLLFHAFLAQSVLRLPPSSRLLSALTTDPPERGLMRANDGNACCCFPFINGSTLAHQTELFIISSLLSAPALLFPPSITSWLRRLPITSFIAQMEWLFSVFLNLYLSCLSLAGLSLTTTHSSMNTNMC